MFPKVAEIVVLVDSHQIKNIWYYPGVHNMEIEFLSGDRYEYQNVPPGLFLSLITAQSVGGYFNTHIRQNHENYPFEKVN